MAQRNTKFFFWLLFASAPTGSFCQASFDRDVYIPGDTTYASGTELYVTSLSNGDYLSSSFHISTNLLGPHVYMGLIHRLSSDGSVLWRRKVVVPSAPTMYLFRSKELIDGSIAATGEFDGTSKGLYLRFDQDGVLLGRRQYQCGTSATEIMDVAQLNDSTLLMLGQAYAPFRGVLIARAHMDGDIIDASILNFPLPTSRMNGLSPCRDGGYLMYGNARRTVSADTAYESVQLVRVDSVGSVLWAEQIEMTSRSNFLRTIGAHELPDGSIRVFGNAMAQAPNSNFTLALALNAQGGLLWKKAVRYPTLAVGAMLRTSCNMGDTAFCLHGGYATTGLTNVVIDTGGTVLDAAGATSSNYSFSGDAVIAPGGQLLAFDLSKFPGGFGQGQRLRFTLTGIEPSLCAPYAFTHVIDTIGVTISGSWTITPEVVDVSDPGALIVVTSEVPEVADNCIVLSTPVYDGRVNVIVFPDPCHDHVTVKGDYAGPLEICDASGRVVRVPMVTSTGAVDLDVSGIQAGLYWISGTSTGRRLLGKFIKE